MRAVVVLVLIALATPAAAHVVVLPATSTAGGWERYSLLVPTESDSPTVRVVLKLPLGIEIVAIEAKPGWDARHDPFPLGAATLTWTGGRIPKGQMLSFDFMAWNPTTARTLTWEATQWYEDGASERWGGAGDDEHHASTTTLAAGDGAGTARHGGHVHAGAPPPPAARTPAPLASGPPPAAAAAPAPAASEESPSLALALALSSLALSVVALMVAASARRRPPGR
jgi:uncharacterized protein YcnI